MMEASLRFEMGGTVGLMEMAVMGGEQAGKMCGYQVGGGGGMWSRHTFSQTRLEPTRLVANAQEELIELEFASHRAKSQWLQNHLVAKTQEELYLIMHRQQDKMRVNVLMPRHRNNLRASYRFTERFCAFDHAKSFRKEEERSKRKIKEKNVLLDFSQ
jgi:hypothetical protein